MEFNAPIVQANAELMLDEIEIDLEGALLVRNGPGCQATSRDVERHMPGVVDPRRLREPDLADDLAAKLQVRAGVAPARDRAMPARFPSVARARNRFGLGCRLRQLHALDDAGPVLRRTRVTCRYCIHGGHHHQRQHHRQQHTPHHDDTDRLAAFGARAVREQQRYRTERHCTGWSSAPVAGE